MAVGLRLIHRRIGLPQQGVRAVAVLWKQTNPDANGELKFATVDEKWLLEGGVHLLGNAVGIPGLLELG